MSGAAFEPVDDGFCIGCGSKSAIGLKMRFDPDGESAVASRVTVGATFAGWRGIVHGGIVALMLDEAMAYAAAARGLLGVTADLHLRFRAPVPVGAELVVRGQVGWQRRNVLGIAASIADSTGRELASAEGRFVSRGPLGPGQRLGDPGRGAT